MAEGIRYVCGNCQKSIEAWSDGNPYYIDENGQKQYAYHPDARFDQCVGNDEPHLCLACGTEFVVDSEKPVSRCPNCEATEIVDTCELDGRQCPRCKAGILARDPDFQCIS